MTYWGKKHSCMLYQLVPMGCTRRTRNEAAAMMAIRAATVRWVTGWPRASRALRRPRAPADRRAPA